MRATSLEDQVRELDEGRAFMGGSLLLAVLVTGGDAARWLNDLVTAGVESLPDGAAVRSLLLTPTGRIRADIHVVGAGAGFVLLQDREQPTPIDQLLEPYVLSSDVALGRAGPGAGPVLVASAAGWSAVPAAPEGGGEAIREATEVWRIRRGIARFPQDLDSDSLPAEAALDPLIDTAKGCFLGQEAVAKVRNLGHPPRVIVAGRADGAVERGDAVVAGDEVGIVTSAAASIAGGSAFIARVKWEARGATLATSSGVALRPA